MTPSTRMCRSRGAIAGSLALVLLAGCFTPTSPGATGGGDRRTNGGSIGAGVAAKGGASGDGAGGAASGTSGGAPVVTAGTTGGGDGRGAVSPAGGSRAPVDPKVYLVGRVLVPPGILSNNGGNVIGQNGGNVIGQNGGNIVSNNGGNVIGQNGGNVIGQNGGNIVSNNGGNVIGQNGGNVIGQNGGNIISNNGGSFRLGQRPLAYASIKVADASGKPRLDKAGKEVVIQADAQGQFELPREAITAHSILRVTSQEFQGELTAFVAKGGEGTEAMDIDAVSTLTSTYILETFVKGRQDVLERLTREIEAEAREDVTQSIEARPETLLESLERAAVVNALARIIGRDTDVADVIKRIEKLLVVIGVTNGGDGMLASNVPLRRIDGMAWTPEGVACFSQYDHAFYRVGTDGILRNLMAPGAWPYPEVRQDHPDGYHSGVQVHDGWLYLCDTTYANRVVRLKDGVVEVLAGRGDRGYSPDGTKATEASLAFPSGIAVTAAGQVYFAEVANGLVRRIRTDGKLETVLGGGSELFATYPRPASEVKLKDPQGLLLLPGGDLLVADRYHNRLRRVDLSNGTVVDWIWSTVLTDPTVMANWGERVMVATRSGKLFSVASDGNSFEEIFSVDPRYDGKQKPWLYAPAALVVNNNSLFIQADGFALVEMTLAAGFPIKEIAGLPNAQVTGTLVNATSLAVNQSGDIVISDLGSNRVLLKTREEALTVIAGNGKREFTSQADNAINVPLGQLSGVAWEGPGSILLATIGVAPFVQRLTLDGRLVTVLGNGRWDESVRPVGPALGVSLRDPREIIPMNDGSIVVYDSGHPQLDVLRPDGYVEPYVGLEMLGRAFGFKSVDGVLYFFDTGRLGVVAHKGAQTNVIIKSEDLGSLVDPRKVVAFATDGKGRHFLATANQIVQVDLASKKSRLLAGVGGGVLNQATRDGGLSDVVDLEVALDGTLLVLEQEQLKQIPAAVIDAF